MSAEWPLVRIADIARNIAIGPFGSRMKSDCYVPSGVPVIRGTNLTGGKSFSGNWVFISDAMADQLGNCCVSAGDLVFPHRGSIGEVGIVTDDFPRYVMSSSLMKLTCNRAKADPIYVYYFFKSEQGKHELLKNASQVGTPGIGQPLTSLKGIEIPLPPAPVQHDIASILSSLDDKIELNRQINQTLEQIAQTIFKSWFVDFEPVKAKTEAKAAGRDPERAAMCAISGKLEHELDQLPPEQYQQLAATAALFSDELVESELGLIPVGWRVGTLAGLCVLNAKSWGTKTIPAQVHYVDLANTKNGEISDVQIFSAEDAPSRARRVLRSGDTIIGTVRPGNRSFALIGASGPVLTGSTGFAVLSPKTEKLRELVFMLATSDLNIDRLTRLADGAAYPAVRPEVVVEEECIIPPDGLAERFHLLAGPLFDQILANREAFGVLATLRDTLLPKLLSGELSVGSQEVASAMETAV